ncbi:MAG: helix-turn-helix transcriptional regulator [Spirochaetales bacterium]|nr:helix-turn-helix transcriptional regulator [Spirochaetales bacterium]
MPKVIRRSTCPIASTLDIVGDKWTLIIVRDLLRGFIRYNDFLDAGEHITTNILADRLKKLEKEKIIGKRPYQYNPVRYEYFLTDKGKDLRPLFTEIIKWAQKYKDEVIGGVL